MKVPSLTPEANPAEKTTYTKEDVQAIIRDIESQRSAQLRQDGWVRELRLAIAVLRREGMSDALYLDDLMNEIVASAQAQAQAAQAGASQPEKAPEEPGS